MGLRGHADAMPPRLSLGRGNGPWSARAMIHDPPILLLDEPFTGLDAEASEWLPRSAFSNWRAVGQTLCFVLHDPEKTRRLADQVFDLAAAPDSACHCLRLRRRPSRSPTPVPPEKELDCGQ